MYYAGIGSRETPPLILTLMHDLAARLAPTWTLRSGRAIGADSAFERGALSANGLTDLYTANSTIPDWAFTHVDTYHPIGSSLVPYHRRLHARNSLILFGPNGPEDPELRSRVSFVLCWTPDAADGSPSRPTSRATGGTGQAIRVAHAYSIPIRNLADPTHLDNARRWLATIP